MSGYDYSTFKTIVDMCNMPSCIFSVEKKDDGGFPKMDNDDGNPYA